MHMGLHVEAVSRVLVNMDSRAPGCRSWFCHLLAVRCGTRDLTSVLCPLCLGFLNSVEKILPTWES